MGLVVDYTHEDGTRYPAAYTYLYSVYMNTIREPAYTDKDDVPHEAANGRGPLVVTFYVYPDEATYKRFGAEVATERVRLDRKSVVMDADLEAQGWAELRKRAAFRSGTVKAD